MSHEWRTQECQNLSSLASCPVTGNSISSLLFQTIQSLCLKEYLYRHQKGCLISRVIIFMTLGKIYSNVWKSIITCFEPRLFKYYPLTIHNLNYYLIFLLFYGSYFTSDFSFYYRNTVFFYRACNPGCFHFFFCESETATSNCKRIEILAVFPVNSNIVIVNTHLPAFPLINVVMDLVMIFKVTSNNI